MWITAIRNSNNVRLDHIRAVMLSCQSMPDTIAANVLRRLRSIVGADNVRTDTGVLEAYARDATPTG